MNVPVEIQCLALATFEDFLAQTGGSVAVSTYLSGKVSMIGWDGRQLTLLTRDFDKPLGLAAAANPTVLALRQAIINPDSSFLLRAGNEIRDDAAATENKNNFDEQNFARPSVEGMAGPVRATATK